MIDPIEPPTQVTFILRGKSYLTPGNITVAQALKRIGLSPEAYLFVRSGEVVTEDQFLHPGDEIRIVPVISGGSNRP
jgi:sulfur carrier protein ThiS